MASISSLGVGSGLDLNGLVEKLLAAERQPVESSLNRQEAKLVSDLSGVGLMKASLSTFRSSLSGLANATSFSTRNINNSNSDALAVIADNSAEVGSYDININALASSQSLASRAYNSPTETIGTGEMQIRFGSISGPGFSSFSVNAEKAIQTITVDSTNNTLAGLNDSINEGDYGITSAIINDGSGYRLTLTSNDTGANNALEISIIDDDTIDTDANGLSALAYNATATNLDENQSASDASISVNGLSISSSNNSLDEVIQGVTLELLETTGSRLKLTIEESSAQLKDSISTVVESYNEMILNLNDLASAGSQTSEPGILFGDAGLRNFTNGLFRVMTSSIPGLNGSVTALTNIGITTSANGTLTINENALERAIAENPTDTLALFAPVGQTTDSLVNFNNNAPSAIPGNYAINITAMATQSALVGASGVNYLNIDDSNDNFSISVDGLTSGDLSLNHGTYASAHELAAEIQSQINSASSLLAGHKSVSVIYDNSNDRFVITSNAFGSNSSLEITAVDANTSSDFGLSVGSGSVGSDVAGTIGGAVASGEGQTLGVIGGLSIDVIGGNTGPRGSVGYSRGFVEDLNALLDGYLNANSGALVTREEGLNASLEDLADERVALETRLESVEARLVRQFTSLDQLLTKFQTTGNFLTQQITSLPGSGQILNKK